MKVVKNEKPITAYWFKVSENSTNFDLLEKEVKEDGNFIEKLSDDQVVITINGVEYTLLLGFVLIIDQTGYGKILTSVQFEEDYMVISEAVDLDDILGRLEALEKQVFKKASAKSATE